LIQAEKDKMLFEKIIELIPAYDHRPKGGCIHGLELMMTLKGPLGTITFQLFTGWMLPEVAEELTRKNLESMTPSPVALYHHRLPYDGEEPSTDTCPYIDDKPCCPDIYYHVATAVFERLLREGHDGVWSALEERYSIFYGEPNYKRSETMKCPTYPDAKENCCCRCDRALELGELELGPNPYASETRRRKNAVKNKKQPRMQEPDQMERCRAARAVIDGYSSEKAKREASLEAFMDIFHSEKAKDRAFMARLKNAAES